MSEKECLSQRIGQGPTVCPLRTEVVAYADDIVILIRGKFLPSISDLMQRALMQLSRWARANGLGVTPAKTEIVLYRKKRKIPDFPPPKLDGVALRFSSEAKYLGVILDQRLNWKRNTEVRAKKGFMALYSYKNSIDTNWGLIVHWLYDTCTSKLSSVQRAASLIISGAIRSTPQAALKVILDIQPLDITIHFQAERTAFRLRESGVWQFSRFGHANIISPFTELLEFSGLNQISDYIPTVLNFNPINVTIPSPPLGGLAIYTDGSKMEDGTGAGVYCENPPIKQPFKLMIIAAFFRQRFLQ
ncbi:uncharacterized protein [Musca autumnalis]|uniref:uncharacterized protein n=1 Tax=Musca autumnalis TaxID=221902 RepID=UPI003CEBE258